MKFEKAKTNLSELSQEPVFTACDYVWAGGEYELAIELGPRDDARLEAAIRAMWEHPALSGCFDRHDREPADQERVPPSLAEMEHGRGTLGVLSLPGGGAKVACATLIGRSEESTIDWVGLLIPIGSLSLVREVGPFPSDDGTPIRPWREPLDQLLVEIARRIYEVTPFRLALIDHDILRETSADKIIASGSIPSERWTGYLFEEETVRGSGVNVLEWYPPTIYHTP